jgi:hypothetical protein
MGLVAVLGDGERFGVGQGLMGWVAVLGDGECFGVGEDLW